MERRYRVMLDPKQHVTKEDAASNAGSIRQRILDNPVHITAEEIAEAFGRGQTICLGDCRKKPGIKNTALSKDHWDSQQVFAVDIDNSEYGRKVAPPLYISLDEAVRMCKSKDIPPAIAYETLSSTPSWEKFRLVWLLDAPVTSQNDFDKVTGAFMSLMAENGKSRADQSCKDRGRLFFGAKKIRLVEPDNIIKKENILELSENLLRATSIGNKTRTKADPAVALTESDLSVVPESAREMVKEIRGMQSGKKPPSIKDSDLCEDITDFIMDEADFGEMDIDHKALSKWPKKALKLDRASDVYEFLRHLPLDILLFGERISYTFNCFLGGAEHDRGKPSATLWYNGTCTDKSRKDEGFINGWAYKCFSCNVAYDIFAVLCQLSGANYKTVTRYLCLKFNICCETEWQEEQRGRLESNFELIGSDTFIDSFPVLYKKMEQGKLFGLYRALVWYGKDLIYDKALTDMEKPVFCLPVRQFVKKLATFNVTKCQRNIVKDIKYLARYGLIEILSDEELSDKFRARLYVCRKKGQRNRMDAYHIPDLTPALMESAQKQILEDAANSVRKGSFCRDAAVMAGKKTAEKSFAQHRYEGVSPNAAFFYETYEAAAKSLVKKKGYTCEQEILLQMQKDKPFMDTLEEKAKAMNKSLQGILEWGTGVCLPRLLQDQGWVRVPFTKKIEKSHKVKRLTGNIKYSYGSSKIILCSL